MRDAIDIHTHLDPDSFGPHSNQAARALDVIDMVRRVRSAGMRGFVIKQHYDQTAQLAYLVRKEVPNVEVFGMLCSNRAVGGLNPEAVHHFAEIIGGHGRIVSMPTWDAENYVRQSRNPTRAAVPVARDGVLLPETIAVIEAIAHAQVRDSGAKLALATGHISAEEALLVIREAKRQGIERIVATHAIGHPINMSMAQMKEAASLGAYIEFVAGFLSGARASFTVQQYYDAIREIGPAHVIFSSDGGQMNRPFPDDLIAQAAHQLHELGLSTGELRTMMVDNPAALLGLPQRLS
ncbi:MAG TPA: DUF6282 family protein [Steroidobacter sp.]|nr:DUF6282 family protein [Steroidobacter sp.]